MAAAASLTSGNQAGLGWKGVARVLGSIWHLVARSCTAEKHLPDLGICGLVVVGKAAWLAGWLSGWLAGQAALDSCSTL